MTRIKILTMKLTQAVHVCTDKLQMKKPPPVAVLPLGMYLWA